MFKRIVVTGSLAFDHIMSMPGSFKDHILPDKLHILNVSFIMKTFRQEFGGTGGNIVWNLGLLGAPSLLIAAAGKDFEPYNKHLSRVKTLDLSGVEIIKNELCARGFVTTDRDDNQIWGFYEGAMRMSKTISLKKFLQAEDLLMVAPNDPSAMLSYISEAIEQKTPYVFDPAFNIPHFDKSSLRKAVNHATLLIGNDYEIELIKKRLGWTKKALVENTNMVITTLGAKGARIEVGTKILHIPTAHPENESDPTGAGDAFRAGFLAGYIRKFPLETCGWMGALTAVYTVEKYGTQAHRFTKSEFMKRYKANFGEDLIL